VYPDGKATLHHVLSEVLNQPWWLLAEALERSGFDEIQDILLMNQAERDMLTFLNANGVVTPLLQVKKNKLLDVKLFSSYCELIGRPIINWTKVTKADFNSIALYMEEEWVTIPHRTMGSHANAIQPRNVPSMVNARCLSTAKARNVTHTATVMPTPMIDFTSADPDVKVTDALDVNITDNLDIKAVDSTLITQTPLEPPTYDLPPVEQQGFLHDFYHYINQGTFGIPCGGKIYHPSLGMNLVAWP